MVKAVLFDVDGVLLDSFEANLKFFQDLMAHNKLRTPTREEFPTIFHLSMLDTISALMPGASEDEVLRVWEMGKTRAVPYPAELLAMPSRAEETIAALAGKYQLGIVTNRVRAGIFRDTPLGKLEVFFKAVAAFEDTEKHKPDPEPLFFVVEQLNVQPSESVYIGDAQSDLDAAKAAGMKFITYSKKPLAQADANTSDFYNLPKIIASLT